MSNVPVRKISDLYFLASPGKNKPKEILKQIFPDDIEEVYIELADEIYEFVRESKELLSSSRANDSLSTSISNTEIPTDELTALASSLNEYFERVKTSKSAGQPVDLLDAQQRFQLFFEAAAKNIQESSIVDKAVRTADSYRQAAANAKENIDKIITKITASLNKIAELNPNNSRVDGLQFRKKHANLIDQFEYHNRGNNNLTDVQKSIMKRLFESLLQFRIATYGELERLAGVILDDYNAYQITDFRDQYSNERNVNYESIKLLNEVLTTATLLFANFVVSIQWYGDVQVIGQRCLHICLAMDLISDYYNGKEVDISELKNFNNVLGRQIHFGAWEIQKLLDALQSNLEINPRHKGAKKQIQS